jgi:hypothetical protein
MQLFYKHLSLSLWSEQISCRCSVWSVKCVVSSGVLIIGICMVRAIQWLFPLILPHAHTSEHCCYSCPCIAQHTHCHVSSGTVLLLTLSLLTQCGLLFCHIFDTRASLIDIGAPGRRIRWRPFNPKFYKLFRPKTGPAYIFECACSSFGQLSGDKSLPAPDFRLFQWRSSASYRPTPWAAVRLAGPLGVSGIIGNVVLVNSGLHMRLKT